MKQSFRKINKIINRLRKNIMNKQIKMLSKGLKKMLYENKPENNELVEITVKISNFNGMIYSGIVKPVHKIYNEKEKKWKNRWEVIGYTFFEKDQNKYRVKIIEEDKRQEQQKGE